MRLGDVLKVQKASKSGTMLGSYIVMSCSAFHYVLAAAAYLEDGAATDAKPSRFSTATPDIGSCENSSAQKLFRGT
jgi:hypothetical protein